MTRSYLVVLATLSLLAVSSPASAASVFHVEGSFAAASGVSFLAIDACGNGGATEGVDSNCFAIPASLGGLQYEAVLVDATGQGSASVCFYDVDGAFMDCETGTVPFGAASVSITSLVAVQASWTFDVFSAE